MKQLDHVRDPWLRLLYAAWLDWRGERQVPDCDIVLYAQATPCTRALVYSRG